MYHDTFQMKQNCNSCPSNTFQGNACSKFLYFVAKVSDEKTWNFITRMHTGLIFRRMLFESVSIIGWSSSREDDSYSFSAKFTFSCMHKS